MFTIQDLNRLISAIVTLITWLYWGGMLWLLWFLLPKAFAKGQSQGGKIFNAAATGLAIVWLFVQAIPFLLVYALGPSKAERQAMAEREQRYQAAEAVFKRQCEHAGEKIYRTVDDVEGIMLLKVIPKSHYSSVYARERAPMLPNIAVDISEGESFIGEILGIYGGEDYQYVDVLQENKQDIIRYTGRLLPLMQELNPKNPARYAVTFEYNLDPELRKHWVAGATIQIIDRQTNEIIAEKITYVFEKGLGNLGRDRMPWFFAITCEDKEITTVSLTDFINKVLLIKQEAQNDNL